jgi:acyl-CoA reductase-like NAD-dependent aldehyde dehydrogenase
MPVAPLVFSRGPEGAMAITGATKRDSRPSQLEVRSPATGELLATLPVDGPEAVAAAVARARRASEVWGALSHAERRAHLLDYRREIVRRMDDIIDTVHRENGKPRAEAASELLLVVNHITHAANRAEALLQPKNVSSGVLAHFKSWISYHPYGVIGVIGPWNYPIFTPTGSIAYALAAGNAVVFKPSELTPLSGKLLVECAQAAIPVPDVLQLVTGFGDTGAALARAKVDKLAFTGSPATGRRVMAAAAENLTPVLLELGGKDAMIVAEDADLERAARAAVFGGLTNSGQACISIERVYVVDAAYERFVEEVVRLTKEVRVGNQDDAHYGAMTMERQVSIVREHVEEALSRGARAIVGGLDSIRGRFIEPIVLVDVTPEMKVMSEETFGPILPICRVTSADEGVRLSNDTGYGLGSSVFAKKGADRLADQLRAGMTAVNAVIAFAGIPALPFGGVGESGFGRIHGDEGILEFARVKATARERIEVPGLSLVFGDPRKQLDQYKTSIRMLYGGSAVDQVGRVLRRFGRS